MGPSWIIFRLLVRVGHDWRNVFFLAGCGLLDKVAGPARSDREVVWRPGTATQAFEKLAEHRYRSPLSNERHA
jgi:hypothetical protein